MIRAMSVCGFMLISSAVTSMSDMELTTTASTVEISFTCQGADATDEVVITGQYCEAQGRYRAYGETKVTGTMGTHLFAAEDVQMKSEGGVYRAAGSKPDGSRFTIVHPEGTAQSAQVRVAVQSSVTQRPYLHAWENKKCRFRTPSIPGGCNAAPPVASSGAIPRIQRSAAAAR